jgi:hypothetical protein
MDKKRSLDYISHRLKAKLLKSRSCWHPQALMKMKGGTSLYIKASNPFLNGLNLQAFFTFGGNGWARGLQVEMGVDLLHGLGVLLPCTPLMMRFTSVVCWDLHIRNIKFSIFRIGDGGLCPCFLLSLAALGGEEQGDAALLSFKLKLILMCFISLLSIAHCTIKRNATWWSWQNQSAQNSEKFQEWCKETKFQECAKICPTSQIGIAHASDRLDLS